MNNQEDNRQQVAEVPFSVRARVAMQLGRESISDSITAILELVKNAYDADAENVHIYFVNIVFNEDTRTLESEDKSYQNPLLVIDDDGMGMTEFQLKNSWMVIGIDNKAVNRRSRKDRALIGEKGLGRLGLDRLCRNTVVQSFVNNTETGVELVINWEKYEETQIRLEDVKHKMYRVSNKLLADPITGNKIPKLQGTRLILENLQDIWDRDNIASLRSQLSLLVSPFAGINDFKIWLHVNNSVEEIFSDGMTEAAEWTVSAVLKKNVDIHGKADWIIEREMIARDGTVYRYNASWNKTFPKRKRENPECGPLTFKMYFLPRKDIEELDFNREQIRAFMNANQGIRIYRDNFRVKPYGEPSGQGDWLKLSFYRVQHPTSRGKRGWRVAYNQVFGAVFIERERNERLLDQTNREGLVETTAYDDLILFTRDAIDWFEDNDIRYVKTVQQIPKIEKAKEEVQATSTAATEAVNDFAKEIESVILSLEESPHVKEKVAPIVRDRLLASYLQVQERVKESNNAHETMGRLYEEKTQELEKEKDTLANLASLGILSVTFGHETLGYSNLVLTNTANLKNKIELASSDYQSQLYEQIKTLLEDIEFGAERIQTFADFTLKYIRRDRRKEVKVHLDKLIDKLLDTFTYTLENKRNITIIREIEDIGPTRAFFIDWESIVLNFITNAVWALEDVPRDDRKIRVRLYKKDNYIHLYFADSGIGVTNDTIDRIFEPTFTTKRDKKGRKNGTGMGLYIVDNLVKFYDGTVQAKSPSDLGGAQFHIKLPFRSDNRGGY